MRIFLLICAIPFFTGSDAEKKQLDRPRGVPMSSSLFWQFIIFSYIKLFIDLFFTERVLYDPNKQDGFQCLDGSKKIPFSKVIFE